MFFVLLRFLRQKVNPLHSSTPASNIESQSHLLDQVKKSPLYFLVDLLVQDFFEGFHEGHKPSLLRGLLLRNQNLGHSELTSLELSFALAILKSAYRDGY